MKMKKVLWMMFTALMIVGLQANSFAGKDMKSLKKNAGLMLTTHSGETMKNSPELDNGKGYFYTSFKPNGFKEEVNIGDELYVRMNLGKTMIELSQEKGIQADYTAYGFITVYIDDVKAFVVGPLSFASNYSKKWLYIDIPLNVNPDFIDKISSDQSMLETEQDIWVFQQLFQENSIPKKYTTSAIKTMTSGSHNLKVEFGLGESDSKEPMAVVCTGTVKISVDAAGANALAQSGPKHLRPLEENEKGQFVFNTSSFVPGNTEIKFNLQLPNPPKYYNMKWCKASSCDYDHGPLLFYVSIDGVALAAWSTDFWDGDYNVKKDFDMMVLPLSDAGYTTNEAAFNTSILHRTEENPLVYALLDMLYGGKLSVGNHKLSFKCYSQECIPYDVTYVFQNSYFIQWPSIAEKTIDLTVTQEGLNKLMSSSCAKKLTHATGEWVAVDKTLLNANSNNPDFQLLDIATTTTWKVITNSLGAILYRECKADVIYKSEYGYRYEKNLVVKEDYSGGGTYGSPYLVNGIGARATAGELGSGHYPVPGTKVK